MIKYYLSFILICLFLLTACSLKEIRPEYRELGQTTVQYATLRYIDEDVKTADSVYEVTQYINEIAEKGSLVSLDVLENEIHRHIPWDSFSLQDQFLIEDLISHVVNHLKQLEVDFGYDPEELEFYALEITQWIEEAALMVKYRQP